MITKDSLGVIFTVNRMNGVGVWYCEIINHESFKYTRVALKYFPEGMSAKQVFKESMMYFDAYMETHLC